MDPNKKALSFGVIPRKGGASQQQQQQQQGSRSGDKARRHSHHANPSNNANPSRHHHPKTHKNNNDDTMYSTTIPRKSNPSLYTNTNTNPHKKAPSLPLRRHLPTAPSGTTATFAHDSSSVRIKSEHPFIVTIKNAKSLLPRTSGREKIKRKRPMYQELEDTDSDDFLTDSDADVAAPAASASFFHHDDDDDQDEGHHHHHDAEDDGRPLKRLKKKSASSSSSLHHADTLMTTTTPHSLSANVAPNTATSSVVVDLNDPNSIESPPMGELSSLWYSQEKYLHVWVLEKILGWKTRPVVTVEWKQNEGKPSNYDARAKDVSSKLVEHDCWSKYPKKRMEISRVNPMQCPMVMHAMAVIEKDKIKKKTTENDDNSQKEQQQQEMPFEIKVDDAATEEVLLVKWRGRSYLHCSWERRKDLEKYDLSNNTARNKIRRFYASQEQTYGTKDWRSVLLQNQIMPITGGDSQEQGDSNMMQQQSQQQQQQQPQYFEEELFPPQNVEVERLLACDENDLDLNVLAKQRKANFQEEQGGGEEKTKSATDASRVQYENLPLVVEGDQPWDPEDYVRYAVKWKGLQYSDVTWEYWKDIKRDAVDQAEDFWFRQKAPDTEEIRVLQQRPHPHIREFRKLEVSPVFGISNRIRAGMPQPIKQAADEESNPGFRLRSYQLEGVNWLLFNWWNRRSCILADEMGLGKTIQSVCFLHQLHHLQTTRVRGPFLIVAPLSLISQWQSESQTWAPDMNIVFFHGSADARNFLVQQEFHYRAQFSSKATAAKLKKMHITKFHILITTYEVVLKDIAVLSKMKWKALIVDEAHRLKNPKSKLFEELATVPREFCLLLTGTPLQNSTEELWALLHFSDPITFKSKEDFVEKFGQLSDSKQVSDLHAILKPYLLRRVKEDVEKSLPPKEETILEVTLTPIQKTFYKAIYERNTTFLFKGTKPSNAPSLMNVMMELRKACNHPFLVRGAEERILADAIKDKREDNETGVIDHVEIFQEQLVKSSGKMVLLSKLLPKLFTGGHKVLIFSQMVRALDLIEELLKWKKYRFERLDGSTTASSRAAAVDRFVRKSCKRFVMLLSTRAGGLGLNLTAADTVIIFDSDWNPQNDLQAMARAHRIGQTRAVRVYRLLTAKTYEMHMFHSASMKLGLSGAVLAQQREEGEDNKGKNEKGMQAKEIDELLKKGAYDVFRDDDDKEAQKFMETDIESLLAQNAKNVTYGKTENSFSSGLGSFNKASFVADTEDGAKDVDLDDPDFWKKAIGLESPVETSEEVQHMIDDGVKRSRKQVIQYDPYAAFAEAEQRKKDKIALKEKEEKEKRARLRLEKKKMKLEKKERLKREKEAKNQKTANTSASKPEIVEVKPDKEPKPKKVKKTERSKSARLAEFEDPMLERLRQAWDVPQRNRASSSLLRFGFGRFCKIRNDSNLNSLPIQDIEIFVRAFIYHHALQTGVMLLSHLKSKMEKSGEESVVTAGTLRAGIGSWLGLTSKEELDWICDSIQSAMAHHLDVEARIKSLRVPATLLEVEYLAEIRRGPALRALRRIGILARLHAVIEDALDATLNAIGMEEVAKRGCLVKDLTTLDADLKSRYVTFEEIALALAGQLSHQNSLFSRMPSAWWDKTCDLALLIGTFVHGFGNYDAMKNDPDLPFAQRIRKHTNADAGCSLAINLFKSAISGTRQVFDDALESSKAKAQLEAHAAVAAAVKAIDAAQTEAAIKDATSGVTEAVNSLDIESDDLHMVTLPRFSKTVVEHVGQKATDDIDVNATDTTETKIEQSHGPTEEKGKRKRSLENEKLYMPDARVLDARLVDVITNIEGGKMQAMEHIVAAGSLLEREESETVSKSRSILNKSRKALVTEASKSYGREFNGIGFNGYQCGTTHRSLDDGTDYAFCSASSDLVNLAQGNDAPRYLRAIGVPITITRYALSSMVHADTDTVDSMVAMEKKRNFPEVKKEVENKKDDQDTDGGSVKIEPSATASKATDEDENATASPSSATSIKPEVVASSVKPDKPSQSEDKNTGAAKPLDVYPPDLIASPMRQDATLRAGICVTALHFGIPSCFSSLDVNPAIIESLSQHAVDMAGQQPMLYTYNDFITRVIDLTGSYSVPPAQEIQRYVESTLLPHCLRMSLYGNGPTTRQTRVSKGTFEAAHGISLFSEPFSKAQTPLPDPTASSSEHSVESILCATALLRRVRLLRAAQYIVSSSSEDCGVDRLCQITTSPLLCRSMEGLPFWWNPPIHDLGLLLAASTGGIFSLLQHREGVFAPEVVEEHIRSMRVTDDAAPHDDDDDEWITLQTTTNFPSANVLERRLGLLCFEAAKQLSGRKDLEDKDKQTQDDARYFHIPMFDHGGWPRN